jgi:CMP/dCMP kinase
MLAIMKRPIITITGFPGSGKSSTAKRVAQNLEYTHRSSGEFMRMMATKRNMSLDELTRIATTDPSIDYEIDDMVRETGKKEENVVIDSRLAFHWIPESFKVFLTIDPHIAAQRTFIHIHTAGRLSETANSVEEVYKNMLARIESECTRYKNYYDVDYRDLKQFDLVIDTALHPLDEVVQIVTEEYKKWLSTPG